MTPLAKRTPFGGRILMLGCGSVGQCTLPLVRRHVDMPADRITVMDFEDVRPRIADSLQAGVVFKRERLTQDNYPALLGSLVGPGDAIVDLSWNVETFDMLSWCAEHRVNYINTSLEEWDPYGDIGSTRAANRPRPRSSTTALTPASSVTSRSGRCSKSPPRCSTAACLRRPA